MLSYRHAFHAGNHADILKHFVLYLVLNYFNQKDKPYWYIDTHGGAGLYQLYDDKAQKTREYRQGIEKLKNSLFLSELLTNFTNHINHILPQKNLYCGSPWLAQSLLRSTDKMRIFELHPNDFSLLQNHMQTAKLHRRCIIKQEDGWQGLLSLLPPPTRRAVILIDPPYEQKQDYTQLIHTLKDALKRFRQGCYLIWYPCLSREESHQLPEQLKKLMPDDYLHTQLYVHHPRPDGFGMHGSGMFVINPPYILTEQLQYTLPELTQKLAQDNYGHFTLNSQIK